MNIIGKKRTIPSSSVLPLWHLPYTAKEQVVLCRRCKRESAAATLYNLLKNNQNSKPVFSKAGVQPLRLEPWYFAEDEQRSPFSTELIRTRSKPSPQHFSAPPHQQHHHPPHLPVHYVPHSEACDLQVDRIHISDESLFPRGNRS